MIKVCSFITFMSLFFNLFQVDTRVPVQMVPEVKSQIVFYRVPDQEQLNAMKKFDIAIVEPRSISDLQLKELQRAGVLVIGYVPVTSIDIVWPPYCGLKNSDFLCLDGKRVVNYKDIYADWVMDPRSTNYREIVLKAGAEVYARGFDGIFMDTVAEAVDFSSNYDKTLQLELLDSTVQLIKEIHNIDQSKILIQNGGWWEPEPFNVVSRTAPFIDFLFWENYDLHKNESWLNKAENVKELSSIYNFRVLAAHFFRPNDFSGVDKFYASAAANGFIPYAPWTTNELNTYASVNLYKINR